MKKIDCSRWFHSSRFGRMVYAGYSDLHGKWTAGFCDGYIRVSAGSYQELVDKLGMPVAATPSCSLGMCRQPIWSGHTGKRWATTRGLSARQVPIAGSFKQPTRRPWAHDEQIGSDCDART